MTVEEYKAKGFRISAQVSPAEVERAERDVIAAYVVKVAPDYDATDATTVECIMQLAAILLLNRHAVVTRSGGKTKDSPQLSQNAYATQDDMENADRLLRAVQSVEGLPSKLVDDIAHIYYRNEFVGP